MHHAAVQGVAHAVDDEGIDNETRIRRHIRNRTSPFFDVIDGDAPRCVPVPVPGQIPLPDASLFAGGPSRAEANCAPYCTGKNVAPRVLVHLLHLLTSIDTQFSDWVRANHHARKTVPTASYKQKE